MTRVIRIIVGLLAGTVTATMPLFLEAVLHWQGMPFIGWLYVVDNIAVIPAFAFGCWLVLAKLWRVESKPVKVTVPPDQWGRRT